MKTKNVIFNLVVLLLFSGFAYGQQTVTLVCDSAALSEGADPTEACYFLPDGEGVNPETYVTVATVGEVITWCGQSTTENDSIDVFMIKYQRGVNVFNKEELPGENCVEGTIEKATPQDDPYKYEIRFKVNSTGKLYKIDPIIRSNAQ